MVALAEIAEDTDSPTAEQMVESLARDHEIIARRLRQATVAAEALQDVVTAGMLAERMRFHEQAVWMLRAVMADN